MNTPDHPTLLCMPPWLGLPEEMVLPLPVDAYEVRELRPDWWLVSERATGQWIYNGLGPVSVRVSPAPF